MSLLTELLGNDDAAWMSTPGRNCDTSAYKDDPKELGAFADRWVPNRDEQAAKAHCKGCPAIDECREHALARPELEGVWGGTTEAERHLLRQDGAA